MIESIPNWINLLFIAAVVYTIVLFHYANGRPKVLTMIIIIWSFFQSILAYTGFYEDTKAMPPRFTLVLIPLILLIIYTLLPKQRAWILSHRNTTISTFLHAVRIPVEMVLLQLFIYKMIPELMTFEGRNFDIIAGVTAPLVGLLFMKGILSKKLLLIWNIIGLILISFILFVGVLSSELPFQQFGFDQPNQAVIHFPFILLPATIVPIVIWTHLSDIYKLIKNNLDNV